MYNEQCTAVNVVALFFVGQLYSLMILFLNFDV